MTINKFNLTGTYCTVSKLTGNLIGVKQLIKQYKCIWKLSPLIINITHLMTVCKNLDQISSYATVSPGVIEGGALA